MGKKRIPLYENMKWFLMVLVVLGHFLEFEYSFERPMVRAIFFGIYVFHMPAFIFLSGLMHRVDAKLRWERILSFVLLGYGYKMMNTLIEGFLDGEWSFSFWKETGIPWFMFAMAVYPVLMYVLRNVKPAFVIAFSIVLACVIGFQKGLGEGYLTLGRIVTYFPFYLVGCYLDAEKVLKFCKKTWCKVLSIVVVVFYVGFLVRDIDAVYWMRHIVTGKNAYSEQALQQGHMFLRLGVFVVAAMLIIACISLIPNRRVPAITDMGGRTLSVYFWHGGVVEVLCFTGVSSTVVSFLNDGLWFALVFAVTLTFVLSMKICSEPIDYVVKGIYNRKQS